MPLSRDAVAHVARLAHLRLTDEEIAVMTSQLSTVVDHVARLQELDTEGVEPSAQSIASQNVMRDDEVKPSWPPDAVLANAPQSQEGYFKVRAVLD